MRFNCFKSQTKLRTRFATYIIGLFIMTAGIAISVKSNLGVSPVSSIPYTITCVFGIEMGNATILFHLALVSIQIVLLRKNFKIISLLQIVVGIIFGKFTTLCNSLVALLPTPDNYVLRIGMVLISIILVAAGIFFYMPANIMPLAGEGAMQAISEVTRIKFSKVKICFDITMVIISAAICLTRLKSLGSVGLGTICSAFLVGTVLGVINHRFGKWRDQLLNETFTSTATEELTSL